jgi:FHA domain-containing protein
MSMFDDLPLPSVDGTPQPADHVPDLQAAFMPPAVSPPSIIPPTARTQVEATVVAPSQPRVPPQADARDVWQGAPHELWAAFCEGADIAPEPQQGIDPDLMRVVGSLLRASVAGTLQLMSVRASAKHELHADVTMIQARNNNPLKFSPDARAALEQMLRPPMRGFLAGPAAMTDAMHDLVGHSIGTMAGTRAALEGVLDRFAPKQLEAKLSVHSVLDSVLPMIRKAKLWVLYLQHFESIRNEAQDDFDSLFGRAFLAAYQQQLERLKRNVRGTT